MTRSSMLKSPGLDASKIPTQLLAHRGLRKRWLKEGLRELCGKAEETNESMSMIGWQAAIAAYQSVLADGLVVLKAASTCQSFWWKRTIVVHLECHPSGCSTASSGCQVNICVSTAKMPQTSWCWWAFVPTSVHGSFHPVNYHSMKLNVCAGIGLTCAALIFCCCFGCASCGPVSRAIVSHGYRDMLCTC